jgi:hypothetical protein
MYLGAQAGSKKLAKKTASPILPGMRAGGRRAHDAVWRQAVEEGLLDLHIIEVVQPKPMLPCYWQLQFQQSPGATGHCQREKLI